VSGPLAQQVVERQGHHLGRLVEVVQRQAFVGAVGVGFLDVVGASAKEHGGDAGRGVVARVGVERHTFGLHRLAHDLRRAFAERFGEGFAAVQRQERDTPTK